jgi:cation diffusion facilitator CzcD-associated flavoprotein CzcO
MRGLTGPRRWMLAPRRAAARRQISSVIKDPVLRAKVTPSDELGCKRIMLTDDWYPTLVQPNVELVTERIAEVTPTGVRTDDGAERRADVLVLATGFETHGFVAPMEISGRYGRKLSETWGDVPRAYLGITVPEFPNMFLMYGPNTNGGAGSVIDIHEAGMEHVIAALREMDRADARAIEVRPAAAEAFQRELVQALGGTVWASGCTNWYVDENGHNPNNWAWGWNEYRRRARAPIAATYELRS